MKINYYISDVFQLIINLSFERFFIQKNQKISNQQSVEKLNVIQFFRNSNNENQLLHRRRLSIVYNFFI